MIRYFIGLMAPSGIRERVYAFAQSIGSKLPKDHTAKPAWNDPTDLHCTLLFIGQYSDEQELTQSMEQAARNLPPVTLTLEGRTHWLGRNSLALAVTGADSVGTAFVEQLGHLSSDNRVGTRPFYGHVTLGRVRPVPRPDDDAFAGHTVEPMTWNADQVQLMRSRNADSGPRYEVVSERPFHGEPTQ